MVVVVTVVVGVEVVDNSCGVVVDNILNVELLLGREDLFWVDFGLTVVVVGVVGIVVVNVVVVISKITVAKTSKIINIVKYYYGHVLFYAVSINIITKYSNCK